MRQKLITLCDASWIIAQRMNNFSAFVRRTTIASERDSPRVEDSHPKHLLAVLHSRIHERIGHQPEAYEDPRSKALMSLMETWDN